MGRRWNGKKFNSSQMIGVNRFNQETNDDGKFNSHNAVIAEEHRFDYNIETSRIPQFGTRRRDINTTTTTTNVDTDSTRLGSNNDKRSIVIRYNQYQSFFHYGRQ
jgi:hypothetical protein